MTLTEFVRLTRANLKLILACLVLGTILGFGYAMVQPTVYESTATGYIGAGTPASVGDAFSGDALGSQRATTYTTLVNSRPVAERVVQELGLAVPAESLVSRASGAVVRGAPLMKITAQASTPTQARDLADAFMKATAEEAARLETSGGDGLPVVRLIPLENALIPTKPVAPQVWRIVAIGAAIGLLIGFAIAIVRLRVDNRVRDIKDVEELTGSQSLGVIPKTPSLSRDEATKNKSGKSTVDELGIAAEALRQLRTNLRYVDVDKPIRCFVVTSPNPGEGKSTIASNLARVLAASGQRTVIIDADLRRPMQARIFQADSEVGLTQVLAGEVPIEEAMIPTDNPLLKLIPAGRIPPNPSEILGSQRMADVLRELSRDHMVLIDAPPLLPVTDAGLLTNLCDGALLVLRVGKTFKEQVKLSTKVLDRVQGRLLGTVMNMANPRSMGSVLYGYGYGGYGNHYYYKSDTSRTTSEVPVPLLESSDQPSADPSAPQSLPARPSPVDTSGSVGASPWTESTGHSSNIDTPTPRAPYPTLPRPSAPDQDTPAFGDRPRRAR
ncbi:MAG: polysaccharide biosynthesis tyrosine autokinase [Propionibacteriaceae bacterium]|nr:polysaccharide biosynthesis tyrosine autokinase [Propionibacteriaceae bacterium]